MSSDALLNPLAERHFAAPDGRTINVTRVLDDLKKLNDADVERAIADAERNVAAIRQRAQEEIRTEREYIRRLRKLCGVKQAKPDAVVRAVDPHAPKLRDRIVEHIQAGKPSTVAALAEELGVRQAAIRMAVHRSGGVLSFGKGDRVLVAKP